MGNQVMLIGLGHLGGRVLDRLVASDHIDHVVAVSRDSNHGERRCNLARLSARAAGGAASLEHRATDVAATDAVASLVAAVSPDVVVHTASLQTWWLLDLFPEHARRPLQEVGYGMWLPWHQSLARAVAMGLDAADYRGTFVNAAYPDVVNVVLARSCRVPDAGVGNVDELVAKVRLVMDDAFPGADDVEISLVAHHALQRYAFTSSGVNTSDSSAVALPPYHLRIDRDGVAVSEEVGKEALLGASPLPSGPGWGDFSAASTVALVEALFAEAPLRRHAPGPGGLPGGYPVRVSRDGVQVDEIPGLSLADAIDINERSHRFDGIDTIGEDGSVVFTERAVAAMDEALGYRCPLLNPADTEARADELEHRFQEYAETHGVDLRRSRL